MLADGIHNIGFLATNVTVSGLVFLLVIALIVTWWIRKTGRSDRHPVLLFASFSSTALIIAVTLIRDRPAFMPDQLFNWSTNGWERISYDPLGSSEHLLNVTLFIPTGVTWTLLTGRPLRVFPALIGLSFLVECVQAVTGAGANDIADLITNSLGAAIGVLVGFSARLLVSDSRAPRTRRRVALGIASAIAIVVAAVVGLHLGAEQRQSALKEEIAGLFGGTTLEEFRDWETEDRLTDDVFGAASVFADGAEHFDDAVRVRYPASFFGLRRCVFVEWTPGDVEIYRDSGFECSESISEYSLAKRL